MQSWRFDVHTIRTWLFSQPARLLGDVASRFSNMVEAIDRRLREDA